MHVVIDGFGGDPERLASEELVRDLLERYPSRIGMTKIAPSHVQRYVGKKPRDWGISGFVLIAESHISIHTFPEHRYVWIDIFSCKSFDASRAMEDVRREFALADMHTRVLERGLEYPHAVEAALPLAAAERKGLTASVGEATP
jgi:S-adenosylmethionine decarboxylase